MVSGEWCVCVTGVYVWCVVCMCGGGVAGTESVCMF